MTKTRLLSACLAACVIISIAVWAVSRQQQLPDSAAARNAASITTNEADPKNALAPPKDPTSHSADATSTEADISEQASSIEPGNSEQTDLEPSIKAQTTNEANPFTVEEPAVASSDDSGTGNISGANAPNADDPSVRRVVEVPASYAVEDAAKYFVPADQRRPGNLGGPPPLPNAISPGGGTTNPPANPLPVVPGQ